MTTAANRTPTPRRWASLDEGADYLEVSRKTLHRLVVDGTVTGYRLGKRSIRVDLNELDALLVPLAQAEPLPRVGMFARSPLPAAPAGE